MNSDNRLRYRLVKMTVALEAVRAQLRNDFARELDKGHRFAILSCLEIVNREFRKAGCADKEDVK